MISDKGLREVHTIAFSKITDALMKYYGSRQSNVAIIIKHNRFIIMKDGKAFETFKMDALDAIFEKIDIQKLRKNLKKL